MIILSIIVAVLAIAFVATAIVFATKLKRHSEMLGLLTVLQLADKDEDPEEPDVDDIEIDFPNSYKEF